MMLTIFVLVILAVCISMTLTEGLWGNTLTLFNVIFAAIIASNYFEPVAAYMSDWLTSFAYFWDFLSLWGLFMLSLVVIRILTDMISKTRVRFKLPVEQVGRISFGFLIGWVVVCFFLFTLHTAPLVRNSFGGGFAKSPTSSNFYFSPDRLWLGFMQSRSEGALATNPPHVFDPQSEFIVKYGQRRQNYSKFSTLRIKAERARYSPQN